MRCSSCGRPLYSIGQDECGDPVVYVRIHNVTVRVKAGRLIVRGKCPACRRYVVWEEPQKVMIAVVHKEVRA